VRFAYDITTMPETGSFAWQRAMGVRRERPMRRREASINDVPIEESDRKFLWEGRIRPTDHPGLTGLGL
jgi:nuclear transport factor 2 (NTF2) superfamily protein